MLLTAALASTGLALAPFGALEGLVATHNPWRGFSADQALLTVGRAEKITLEGDSAQACAKWNRAVAELQPGKKLPEPSKFEGWAGPLDEWAPWADEELSALKECDHFPCKFKLDRSEVTHMAQASPSARKDTFLNLVMGRVERYLKTEARKEYEFPGNPVEPWKLFEARGLHTSVTLPGRDKAEIFLRRLDLSTEIRPLRQALDKRYAVSNTSIGTKSEVTLWIRDVYSAHYFDSWGEWLDVTCDPSLKQVFLVHSLLLEFDPLKKHDIISILGRDRLRSGTREIGYAYLNEIAHALKKSVSSYESTSAKSRPEIPSK